MTIDTNYIYFLVSKNLKIEIEKKCIVKISSKTKKWIKNFVQKGN